jgi:hypothetical protein
MSAIVEQAQMEYAIVPWEMPTRTTPPATRLSATVAAPDGKASVAADPALFTRRELLVSGIAVGVPGLIAGVAGMRRGFIRVGAATAVPELHRPTGAVQFAVAPEGMDRATHSAWYEDRVIWDRRRG